MAYALLSWDEEDALRRVLRHHGVQVERRLVKDLAALINRVREIEQTKVMMSPDDRASLTGGPWLSFLGSLGIYGAEAINPSPSNAPPLNPDPPTKEAPDAE